VSEWDNRIDAYWSEQLSIDTTLLAHTGVVSQFSDTLKERVIVYYFDTLTLVLIPEYLRPSLPAKSTLTLDDIGHHLSIPLTIKWRDHVYYASTPIAVRSLDNTRPLTPSDALALKALKARCTKSELRLAEINIDDPLLTGHFIDGQLVGVASVLEFKHDIDDIGVLTDPAFRGRGIAPALTARLRNQIVARGHVAQYSTMESNLGSVRIAEKTGFSLYVVEERFIVKEN
jgi:RimJ/RimL family protein N-acetyltransferase